MKADMVYIDGDHEYEGVKADLEAFYPIVKEGGLIFGDDKPYSYVMRAVEDVVRDLNGTLQLIDWKEEKHTWLAWNGPPK